MWGLWVCRQCWNFKTQGLRWLRDLQHEREWRLFLIGIVGDGVQLYPIGTAATNRPIVPALGDYDVGEIGGMIGRGNRSTRRKPAPVPLCPPNTPHAARTRTRAAAVGSQRLTAWATARPMSSWYRLFNRRTRESWTGQTLNMCHLIFFLFIILYITIMKM
jgi:hypothetical protein